MFVALNHGVQRSLQRVKSQKMREFGMTSAQANCLCLLLAAGETGMTQSELVQQVMLDPSQISRVVRELIGRGCVVVNGEEGKYRRRYLLTDAGRSVAKQISAAVEEVCQYVCRDIPEGEMVAFFDVFQKICDELRNVEKNGKSGQTDE